MSFFDLHQGLPREGPGTDASTERALRLLPTLPARPAILDVGSGPGAQTLVLARATKGSITAIDIHQPFLDELKSRARAVGVADQITTLQASMDALPFESDSFDLIWAEGSIYIIGFEFGLKRWLDLVRPGGYIAVSELTWLTDAPPEAARRFWSEAYPAMTSVAENRASIERCGLRTVSDFVLPQEAWFEDYLDPLSARISALQERYADDPAALQFLKKQRLEIDIVRRYGTAFGYVFYLAQR
ncbi:MAG: class I SAM-dependent methyltransferase [Vulcanimicrobiaceae bacterium]